MTELSNSFFTKARNMATDTTGYEVLQGNLTGYNCRMAQTKSFFPNFEDLRNRASYIRAKGIRNIERYLKEFETKFSEHQGNVIWAINEDEARMAILNILQTTNAKNVITTHSATLNEIAIKSHLPKEIHLTETSFCDFLEQAIDDSNLDLLRKNDIETATLVSETFQTDIELNRSSVIQFVEGTMHSHFLDADAVITGANFLVADIGGVALSENEGNISRACAFAKTHIVVAGYDKIIPSIQNLETLWTSFACAGDGTLLTAYNHLLLGAQNALENDGPQAMYIIVINNGRDKILKQLEQQQALHCIHCNACKYHCPVWQTIGEKSYQTPYSGPIGAVVMPLLRDTAKYSFLTYSAGISEKIQQHCPVKIPINELILYNRALFVKESSNDKSFLLNFMVKKSLLFFCDRNIMNTSSRRKTNFLRFVTRKQPYVRFSIPPFAKKTFNELYKEQLLND